MKRQKQGGEVEKFSHSFAAKPVDYETLRVQYVCLQDEHEELLAKYNELLEDFEETDKQNKKLSSATHFLKQDLRDLRKIVQDTLAKMTKLLSSVSCSLNDAMDDFESKIEDMEDEIMKAEKVDSDEDE